MNREEAEKIFLQIRNKFNIEDFEFDILMIKELAKTNTLHESNSNQTHIAITGKQMDVFPYLENYGHLIEGHKDFKKRFLLRIPVILSKNNLKYLNNEIIEPQDSFVETFTHFNRSKRSEGFQGELSYLKGEDDNFLTKFRKKINPNDYLIVVKKKEKFEYMFIGLKKSDAEEIIKNVSEEIFDEQERKEFLKTISSTQYFDEVNPGTGKNVTPIVEGNIIEISENETFDNNKVIELFIEWMIDIKKLAFRSVENYSKRYFPKIANEVVEKNLIENTSDFYFGDSSFLEKIKKEYFSIEEVKEKNKRYNNSFSATFGNFIEFKKYLENHKINEIKKLDSPYLISLNLPYQKIVYGAPGTGKSYSLSKEINALFSDFSIESEILDKQNPDISFWLVGATWGSDNKYDEFINNNYWINGWDDGYDFERAKNMKIGDYIIIKTSYFTGEKNSTPTLEIKAIGKITEISQSGKKVEVNWLKKNLGIVIKGENFRSTVHNISKRFSLIDKIFTNQNLLNSYSEDIKTKERVTFYDGYTYGQFVGAYKPVPIVDENEKADITYNYIPGPLFRHLVKAFNNPKHNFVLIIEEINRARVDRVFGNIFQLLDRDKTGKSEYPISLSEEQNQYFRENMDGEKYAETIEKEGGLYLPSNFYIWATMNSADQGVYPMDSAFKRRWNFEYIGLDKNAENFGDGESTYYIPLYKTGDISEKGNLSHEVVEWNDFRKTINNILLHEVKVPEDRLFAPFFVKPENFEYKDPEHEKNLWINEEVFKSKILMYLFDDILRHRGKEKIFSSNIRSFSELIATYEAGENIFNEEITKQLLKKEEPKVQE